MGKRPLVRRRGRGGNQFRSTSTGKVGKTANYPRFPLAENHVGEIIDLVHERGREAPLSKVKEARQLIDKHNYDVELCVDGGINEKTAPLAIEAGVDVVVSGAGILYKDDMIKAVEDLRALASK